MKSEIDTAIEKVKERQRVRERWGKRESEKESFSRVV
jgi:hypothetical protein